MTAVLPATPSTAAPEPILVGGRWQTSPEQLVVEDPAHPDTPAGATWLATDEQLDAALEAAVAAFEVTRRSAGYERGALLRAIADGVLARRDELASRIAREIGKPIRDAVVEVERTALCYRMAAAEAERLGSGETMPLDLNAASAGRWGLTRRFAIGPVAAISPFNLPLGLSVHKLAPAIAAGCPIVLKPPSAAPLSVLAMARIITEAGAPDGSVSVLPMSRRLGDRLVEDRRPRLLTFTGSPTVGWAMKERAGKKRVLLELGGNAGAIVDRSADLDHAVARCLVGAFKFAGQLCVSIQRLLLHEDIASGFLERFLVGAAALRIGDPADPATDIGPMIDRASAERAQSWLEEAVAAGARIMVGGEVDPPWFTPTVLTEVPPTARICTEEAFAPVVVVSTFRSMAEAVDRVNDSAYGLQAGVFTDDLQHAMAAFERLDVGGVIVNDIPSYRIDHMPFGGVKDSGQGREGLRWAIEEMTDLRLMVMA